LEDYGRDLISHAFFLLSELRRCLPGRRIGLSQSGQEPVAKTGRQIEDAAAHCEPDDVPGAIENRRAVSANAKMVFQPLTKVGVQIPVHILGNQLMHCSTTDFDKQQETPSDFAVPVTPKPCSPSWRGFELCTSDS